MKKQLVIKDTLERHRQFWSREPVETPLIGMEFGVDLLVNNWCPAFDNALFSEVDLLPEMIVPEQHRELYLFSYNTSNKILDDTVRVLSPLSSVPWMEAFIGCDLKVREGRVWAEYGGTRPPDLDVCYSRLTESNVWIEKYREFIDFFAGEFPDIPIGQPLLRGPTDLAGLLCGSTDHLLMLYDRPQYMRDLLRFCTDAFIFFAKNTTEYTPSWDGGYFFGTFSLWAPGECIRFQEDFTSLYSPEFYDTFIADLDNTIAGTVPFSIFHLHTSQLHLIENIASLSALKTVQITRDINISNIDTVLSASKKVQKAGKSLILRGAFSQSDIEQMRESLSPRGLYIQNIIRIDELNTYAATIKTLWKQPWQVGRIHR